VEELLRDLHRVVSGVQWELRSRAWRGALGEATLANFFQGVWPGSIASRSAVLAHALALPARLFSLSFLHVVIGELVPKRVVWRVRSASRFW